MKRVFKSGEESIDCNSAEEDFYSEDRYILVKSKALNTIYLVTEPGGDEYDYTAVAIYPLDAYACGAHKPSDYHVTSISKFLEELIGEGFEVFSVTPEEMSQVFLGGLL